MRMLAGLMVVVMVVVVRTGAEGRNRGLVNEIHREEQNGTKDHLDGAVSAAEPPQDTRRRREHVVQIGPERH